MVSKEQGKRLVRLARSAIEAAFEGKKITADGKSAKQGAFVTLTKGGELRGCIGFPEPVMPLNEAVAQAAVEAAFNDPRFPPVAKDELKGIRIEVSVLSPLKKLAGPAKDYPKKIKVGRDGLVIELGGCRGLLLPQVPLEFKWGAEEFLCHLSMKAGLPPDAWTDSKAKLFRFEAQIFNEE